MKLKADLFPYPVLSDTTDDYIDSKFSTEYRVQQVTPSRMKLEVIFHLSDPGLEDLVDNGKAGYAVHVEGVASSYRQLSIVNKHQNTITIFLDTAKVGAVVEVNMVLIALEKIVNYESSRLNLDFYGNDYHIGLIERGDILAFVPYVTLKFSLKNKIHSNAESMIRVTGTSQDYMSVDLDSDVILVRLPKKVFQQYKTLSASNQATQDMVMTMVILPTLSYVINRVQIGGDIEDKEWYASLKTLLKSLHYNEETIKEADALMVAQKLLDYPLTTAFEKYYVERELIDEN